MNFCLAQQEQLSPPLGLGVDGRSLQTPGGAQRLWEAEH